MWAKTPISLARRNLAAPAAPPGFASPEPTGIQRCPHQSDGPLTLEYAQTLRALKGRNHGPDRRFRTWQYTLLKFAVTMTQANASSARHALGGGLWITPRPGPFGYLILVRATGTINKSSPKTGSKPHHPASIVRLRLSMWLNTQRKQLPMLPPPASPRSVRLQHHLGRPGPRLVVVWRCTMDAMS